MPKLNHQQRKEVEIKKKEIEDLNDQIDKTYASLTKTIDYDCDWLWDYVFNDNQRAVKELFEDE